MSESAWPPRTGGGPEQLIKLVPHLLGYHPSDALVAIFDQPGHRLPHAVCLPLHQPTEALLEHLALRMPTHTAGAVLIGYGLAGAHVKITAIGEVLQLMVPVRRRLLFSDGVLTCLTSGCTCPAVSGVPVTVDTETAAEPAFAGREALPSQQALHSLVAADADGQAATAAALTTLGDRHTPQVSVACLMDQARTGALNVQQVARLCAALQHHDGRVQAWHLTDHWMWQRALWLDVTRRAPGSYAATPANLAAWCAWRRGEDALAAAALDRARSIAPSDGFTRIIGYLVGAHLPAHRIGWPLGEHRDTAPARSRQ